MFGPKCSSYCLTEESSSSQGHHDLQQPYPPALSSAGDRPFSCDSFGSGGSLMGQQQLPREFVASLLYNLSVLQDKVHQVRSLVNLYISPIDHSQNQNQLESTPIAVANMSSLVQDMIGAASSMMLTCQKFSFYSCNSEEQHDMKLSELSEPAELIPQSMFEAVDHHQFLGNINLDQERSGVSYAGTSADQDFDWFNEDKVNNPNPNVQRDTNISQIRNESIVREKNNSVNIVELDAANLLAKYTHYCQVCGKGFKRDANLRMHMRAHGDEYKTASALVNPSKHSSLSEPQKVKYSCPQEGCKWNQKHVKFQPLKSIICVKNHYKRSHCPKMYVCKRCNTKQFSVLSDLRTHEKHCGDLRWVCSCGTVFSRKDKLMGHVALFVGHTPVVGLPAQMKASEKATEVCR